MHYRVRGNSVQLVKTEQDAEKGRAVSRPVGSAKLNTGELSERAKQSLTPEEVADVQEWMEKRRNLDAVRRRLEAQALPATIGSVAQWLREAPPEQVEEIADDLRFSINNLRKVLRRRTKGDADQPDETGLDEADEE
jgi:hypothetical protein